MTNSPPWQVGQMLYFLEDKDRQHWAQDYNGEYYPTGWYHATCKIIECRVEKLTPKGAWIQVGISGEIRPFRKWASFNTKKFHDSVESSIDAAIRKRKYHIKMIKNRLERAERRLYSIESFKKKWGDMDELDEIFDFS
jgi:hypothetical protein